jgi:hypothetical protein
VINRLFPAFRDRGVYVTKTIDVDHGETQVQVLGGFVNGTGPNRNDNNASKDVIARVEAHRGEWSGGLSLYDGRWYNDQTKQTTPNDRWGIDLRYAEGKVEVWGEYVEGRGEYRSPQPGGNKKLKGWYLHAMHQLGERPQWVYVRGEQCDPDDRAANDQLQIISLGYVEKIRPNLRVVVAHDFVDDQSRVIRGDLSTVELQVSY